MAIARAIGPATARTLAPYDFSMPPEIKMNGLIPFDDIESADAFFEVDGVPSGNFTFPPSAATFNGTMKSLQLAMCRLLFTKVN